MLNRSSLSLKMLLLLLLLTLTPAACRASRHSAPPARPPTPGSQPAPTATSVPRPSPTLELTARPGSVSSPTSQSISMPMPTPPPISPELIASLEESTTDILGFYKTSPEYQKAVDAGVRVVNVPELGSFFALWIPENYAQQEMRRVMAVAPGSNGIVYKSFDLRIGHARNHGYALAVVQWWMGERETYLDPSVVYSLLATALEYVGVHYGADIHKAAYEGFSRGSAIAYNVAYWDRALDSNYFDLFICHSGGMHDPGPPFIEGLRAGSWGTDVFSGQHFYLYCGKQDKEWGPAMCEYMHNAEQIVTEYGGTVERFVEDPEGGHADFLLTDDYYEDAIQVWFELTR